MSTIDLTDTHAPTSTLPRPCPSPPPSGPSFLAQLVAVGPEATVALAQHLPFLEADALVRMAALTRGFPEERPPL
jgi:hypothetical protein